MRVGHVIQILFEIGRFERAEETLLELQRCAEDLSFAFQR